MDQNFEKSKHLKNILLIAGLILIAVGVIAVIMDHWMGILAILIGALLGFTGIPMRRTINERYNPMVEGAGPDKKRKSDPHPMDVPLNPWDNITTQEEKKV